MVLLDPFLSLIALLVGPPLILVVRYLARRLRSIHRESVTLNSHLLGAMQEATQGIAIVKAFTMEDQLRIKISALIKRAEERANKIARVSERTDPDHRAHRRHRNRLDDRLHGLPRCLSMPSHPAPCSAS